MSNCTLRCRGCGKPEKVEVDYETIKDWWNMPRGIRPLIQDQFPWLTADEREMILTATCPVCWELLFEEESADTLMKMFNSQEMPELVQGVLH